jgi:hypothetical protein
VDWPAPPISHAGLNVQRSSFLRAKDGIPDFIPAETAFARVVSANPTYHSQLAMRSPNPLLARLPSTDRGPLARFTKAFDRSLFITKRLNMAWLDLGG